MKIYMNKKILITWTSRWLWNFLVSWLKNDYEVFWISRNPRQENDIKQFNIDLTKFELFNKIQNFFEQEKVELDWIILNAWIWAFWNFTDFSDEEYINLINLNLTSQILLLKKLEKFLKKDAKIVFIWSISSRKFFKHWAVYQASKFWLRWFAGSLKNEWKDKKIYFLNPRILDTGFHDNAKVELSFNNEDYTNKEDILKTIKDILSWKEKRFEIDY